ncbi:hypothetical protein UlMin_026162 [Ulmus minor]
MTEHKRSPCSVDQSSFTSLSSKRQKPDLSISSKDKKENLGAWIVAFQQLVSPYGNTDTTSVLNEAMEYIQFLHEQVQVYPLPFFYVQSKANDFHRLNNAREKVDKPTASVLTVTPAS